MTCSIAADDGSRGEIFPELTRDVIARVKDAKNPRLREILELVVRHVHACRSRSSAVSVASFAQLMGRQLAMVLMKSSSTLHLALGWQSC